MKPLNSSGSATEKPAAARWFWAAISIGVALLVLMVLLSPRQQRHPLAGESSAAVSGVDGNSAGVASEGGVYKRARSARSHPATAREIVADKVSQFADSRRQIAYAMARKLNMRVPPEVNRFFELAASGNWDELEATFNELKARRQEDSWAREVQAIWPTILETFGVAEQAHLWPAQKLLDYGNSILASLKPGMVYIGGTDPGRFIPTLLNETQGGERHIVVTQNALADGTYLEYLRFLYSDRFGTLTPDDSRGAFADYLQDVEGRYEHDQKFQNEPRQLRSGENIEKSKGRVSISGAVAVMSINEKLIRKLMEKNPDLSFAIEQSYAFTSMYGTTAPLGPIMELGVRDEQRPVTSERAAESVNYWRATAQEFSSNPEAANSPETRKTYGKMAAEQAALLLHHQHAAEAEEAFRLATQISPESPEAVLGYVNILVQQKRFAEAVPLLETAARMGTAEQKQFQARIEEVKQSMSVAGR